MECVGVIDIAQSSLKAMPTSKADRCRLVASAVNGVLQNVIDCNASTAPTLIVFG